MIITIDVTQEELNDMALDEWELVDYVIEGIDEKAKVLLNCQVNVNSKENK